MYILKSRAWIANLESQMHNTYYYYGQSVVESGHNLDPDPYFSLSGGRIQILVRTKKTDPKFIIADPQHILLLLLLRLDPDPNFFLSEDASG